MARNQYQYTTSPRKLEPDDQRKRRKQKKNLKTVQSLPRQKVKISEEQRKRQIKMTLLVISIFILLLTISYRNSQINEKFSRMQTLKKELSSLQKENEQLKVNIQNSLTLNTIEKMAKEKLGMQKLTNKQTMYITLPKKDYVETASEKVIIDDDKNLWETLLDKIFNR